MEKRSAHDKALLVWFLWRAIHAGEDEQPPVGGPATQDMGRPA